MKVRSMMCVGAVALTAAAFATDVLTDEKTLGWMRVDSPLTVTAVGVPWVDVENTNTAVKVANLVKTDNLTAGDATTGDKLYVYSDRTWKMYYLNSSGNVWTGVGTTKQMGKTSVTISAGGANDPIARGQALYLERHSPTNTDGSAKSFYVYGAVGSAVPSQTLVAGKKYLLASPKAEAFDLNGSGKITSASVNDVITVPQEGGWSLIYTYSSGTWGYQVNRAATTADVTAMPWLTEGDPVSVRVTDCTIPLGTGFWYETAAGSTPTINW